MARLLIFLISIAAFAQQNQYVLVPSASGTGRLIFRERAANGTNEVRLKAPDDIAADVDFIMPAADGGANFSIATDGSGVLSFKEMVTAFTHPGVQTIASDKYFASGLRTLDFELRNTVSGPLVMQSYVTGWDSGNLEMFSSGGILTLAMMSENGGVGGQPLLELYDVSTGLPKLSLDGRGLLEFTQIATPSAAPAGRQDLYFKPSGELCSIDSAGTELCYGASTSLLEMPVNFTVSGVTRAQMYNTTGNVHLYLKNASGYSGVSLDNFVGGSEIRLVDTNGESNAMLQSGGSNGATLDLYADNSTTRTGVLLQGGQFTTGGSIKTFSLSSALVNRLDDSGLLTTTGEMRTLKMDGSISGSISLTVPAVTSTYALSLPGSSGATGQCPVLSSPSVLAWGTCITSLAGVFALPINFTVSGVTKATLTSASGNVFMDMQNSSGITGASVGSDGSGGYMLLSDISGVGYVHLATDSTNGAMLKLFAKNTTRVGVYLEGGPFAGGGIISTYDVGSTLINKLDSTGIYTTAVDTGTMKMRGSLSGSLLFTLPAASSTYTVSWPGSAGTAGQCPVLSSPSALTWGTCSGGSYMDLTTNQTAAGNKYFSSSAKAFQFGVSATSGGSPYWQAYMAGATYGVSEVWSSTGVSFPTVQMIGNYSSNSVGSIDFPDPSTGSARARLNGGSTGFNPALTFYNTAGSTVLRMFASSGFGGELAIYSSTPTQVIRLSGQSGGTIQVHDGVGLVSGITATINTHAGCIFDVVKGIITGSSGC